MYYHINDIIFLVRFPQFVGSPPRDVWTTAYWRGRPSATSPLSARTLTLSPFLSLSNLFSSSSIYIYIGRRSATIRTALLSLLCTRRFFTCEMMSNRIPPLQTATVLEFQLSGSKGLRLKKKQETRGKFFNHGERSASQLRVALIAFIEKEKIWMLRFQRKILDNSSYATA